MRKSNLNLDVVVTDGLFSISEKGNILFEMPLTLLNLRYHDPGNITLNINNNSTNHVKITGDINGKKENS